MATSRMHDARTSTISTAPALRTPLSPPPDAARTSARSSQATTLNAEGGLADHKTATIAPPPPAEATSYNDLEFGELNEFSRTLARLRDARLDRQRYVMSEGKDADMSRLAFSAKVERALARRMVGQDAVFSHPSVAAGKKKPLDAEKRALYAAAN